MSDHGMQTGTPVLEVGRSHHVRARRRAVRRRQPQRHRVRDRRRRRRARRSGGRVRPRRSRRQAVRLPRVLAGRPRPARHGGASAHAQRLLLGHARPGERRRPAHRQDRSSRGHVVRGRPSRTSRSRRSRSANAPADDDPRTDFSLTEPDGNEVQVNEVELPDRKLTVAMMPARMATVTDMAYTDGVLLVAGMSNEEFSSNLRRIPFPFTGEVADNSTEIFHVSHGMWETAAPIRTFVPYEGGRSILASYTCTPLVHFPLDDLTSGSQVKGRTVAELGHGNQPLDMVSFAQGGDEYLLISHSTHPLMKVACRDIDTQEALTEPKEPYGRAAPRPRHPGRQPPGQLQRRLRARRAAGRLGHAAPSLAEDGVALSPRSTRGGRTPVRLEWWEDDGGTVGLRLTGLRGRVRCATSTPSRSGAAISRLPDRARVLRRRGARLGRVRRHPGPRGAVRRRRARAHVRASVRVPRRDVVHHARAPFGRRRRGSRRQLRPR